MTAHNEIEWTSGAEVIESMAPQWRNHLGPREIVDEAYSHYRQKNFTLAPSTRRFDVISCAAGYSDATAAYHDTVEESLILDGTCLIDGEGVFETGHYFWRPPGWVHRSHTEEGFTALLSLEGVNPAEGSAGASRVVRDQEVVGQRVVGHLGTDGGRDRVIKVAVDDVAPQALATVPLPWADTAGDTALIRVLSTHTGTGASSLVVDLDELASLTGIKLADLTTQAYVMAGRILTDGRELEAGSFIEVSAGETASDLVAVSAARLFVKTNVDTRGGGHDA